MSIWGTLRDIFRLCWHERWLALKFGTVPVLVNIGLAVFLTTAAPSSVADYARNWSISLVSILAFAPFCVAWYRIIIFGHEAVAARSFFAVTPLELRFFGWTLAISGMAALVGVIVTVVGVTIFIVLTAVNEMLGIIGGVVMFFAAFAVLLMTLSRWSVGLAMVASGHPMNLTQAWEVTKPYGWKMSAVQMIIFLSIAIVSGLLLIRALPDFMEAVRTKTAASEISQVTVQLVGTVSGALALWLTSTMYALVYRMIEPQSQSEAANSLTSPPEHGA